MNGTRTDSRPEVRCEEVACPTTSSALREVASRLRSTIDDDRPTRTRFLAQRPPAEASTDDPSTIVVWVFVRDAETTP